MQKLRFCKSIIAEASGLVNGLEDDRENDGENDSIKVPEDVIVQTTSEHRLK